MVGVCGTGQLDGLGGRGLDGLASGPAADGDRRGAVPEDVSQGAIDRARAGGPDAFGELFARYDADVLRVCRRILGSREAAEDARGEVFLRAQRGFASFEDGRPFRPWLLAIAGNWCIDHLRRRALEQRLFAEPTAEEALPAAGSSPLSQAMATQRSVQLGRAIERLPVRYRLPLVLRYFADEEYAEIARTLGVSRNQVGSLLFRAKRMLRASLADAVARDEEEER